MAKNKVTDLEEEKGVTEDVQSIHENVTLSHQPETTEIAKETAWILPRNKKRKAEFSPETTQQEEKKNQSDTQTKITRLPPIILSDLNDYSQLSNLLKQSSYKTKMLNNNQVKINVDAGEEYRNMTKILNEKKFQWHSYENKQIRPIRVVVKDLHQSCKEEEIKDDLLNKGFRILDVVNKMKKK